MPKKLIEVALPLEAINKESAREKSIRHGHPGTLHLWWSRKPLATCRAVLFASLVDDPSSHPEQFPTEEKQNEERQRLFCIIEDLVKWENSNNERVLTQARAEIIRSCNGNPPSVLDPFCGGGSIPLEAQRLGLEAHASDLNPVAVLINKALIEIPPNFANMLPVNPEARTKYLPSKIWHGVQGLAEDILFYGKLMRDEAEKQIGYLYPKVLLPVEYGSGEATIMAWIYYRSVYCPNPACNKLMPLTSKFWLASKKGKRVWTAPVLDTQSNLMSFIVKTGEPDLLTIKQNNIGTSLINDTGKKVKATFKCILCKQGIAKGDYIDREANSGRLHLTPVAIVAEGKKSRYYLPFDEKQINIAMVESKNYIDGLSIKSKLPNEPTRGTFASNAQGRSYGFKTFADYFIPRQLATLITFIELLKEVQEKICSDFLESGTFDTTKRKDLAKDYSKAVITYLALSIDKLVDRNSGVVSWAHNREHARNTFTRQSISITWDIAESNPFSSSSGNFLGGIETISNILNTLFPCYPDYKGKAQMLDAVSNLNSRNTLISTDPPYYDSVSYSDLADFFYVWLRRSLGTIYPDLFGTMLCPKSQELIVNPYRFGGSKEQSKQFFESGLGKAFVEMHKSSGDSFPMTIFYAFKQSESAEEGDEDNEDFDTQNNTNDLTISSTGWETMLEGLLKASFQITGTWPIRTELSRRLVGQGTNALASSIVLVCRPRPTNAQTATRREFLNALKKELPDALKKLQQGNIAPVDLAQASIGPGMAIYSRYSQVLESDGKPMPVRTALALINQALDEYLSEQEGEFDADTRWALAWFETVGMEEGTFGIAETLSKAKNTGIDGLKRAGILDAKGGKVRLLKRQELLKDWDPTTDKRITAWEATQYLIRAIDEKGETGAAQLLNKLGGLGDVARDLAYRLYSICERKKWAQEAMAYNGLVIAWPEIAKLASQLDSQGSVEGQLSLF